MMTAMIVRMKMDCSLIRMILQIAFGKGVKELRWGSSINLLIDANSYLANQKEFKNV